MLSLDLKEKGKKPSAPTLLLPLTQLKIDLYALILRSLIKSQKAGNKIDLTIQTIRADATQTLCAKC